MATAFLSLDSLSDEQLLARVKTLSEHERQATAALIAALTELDARRLYLGEGYPSLFAYCTQALHLSEEPVRICWLVRPLCRNRIPRVSPRRPIRGWRCGDGVEHPAPLPGAQCLRS
jgi:hypothetical protein